MSYLNMRPKVSILRDAMDDMTFEVLDFPNIETSWDLAGVVINERDVIITHVVLPGPASVRRGTGTTVIGGGQYQLECLRWLTTNFERFRARHPAEYPVNSRFDFLFSGHSHHRLNIPHYSGVDINSMKKAVIEDGLSVAVGPLANIRNQSFSYLNARRMSHVTTVATNSDVDWKIYYLSARMVNSGNKEPIVVPLDNIYAKMNVKIPQLPWHLANQQSYERQLMQLKNYGCSVDVSTKDVPGEEYLLVQFMISKPNWETPLIVMTRWDHPKTAPDFYIFKSGVKTKLGDILVLSDGSAIKIWQPEMDIFEVVVRLWEYGVLL